MPPRTHWSGLLITHSTTDLNLTLLERSLVCCWSWTTLSSLACSILPHVWTQKSRKSSAYCTSSPRERLPNRGNRFNDYPYAVHLDFPPVPFVRSSRLPRFRLHLACLFSLRYCLLRLYWVFCAVNFLQNRNDITTEAVTGSCAIPRAESRLEIRNYDECPKTVSRAQRSPVLAPCSTLGSHKGLRTNGLLGQRLGAEIRKQMPRSDFELDPSATPRQGF